MARETITLKDIRIVLRDDNDVQRIVGGAQSLNFKREQGNVVLGEGGTNNPIGIQDGDVRINGTIEILNFFDGTLKTLFDLEDGYNPYFTLTGTSTKPGSNASFTLEEVKFKDFDINMVLGGEPTKSSLPFDALRIRID